MSEKSMWYVVGLLSIVNMVSYMDRTALSVLAPAIKAELALSDSQLGLLTGLAFSLFYAVCGIPVGRWADRGVRRDIIAIALLVWSVMTALSGAARNFWHLFIARVGIGAGESGCLPASSSLVCDYVPLEKRSGIFAIHSFGSYAGIMAGMALAGMLGEVIGWRWTFVALGVPGILLAVVVRLTLREPVRGALDGIKEDSAHLPLAATLAVLWRARTYRLLVVLYALYGFVIYGTSQWWPSFFVRSYGLNLGYVGASLGLAIGAGSGLGLLLGGFLSNKAARSDVRMPLIIGAATSALAIPTVLGALFIESAEGSMVLVGLTALCLSASNGPIIANVNSVVSPNMRATAISISIFFGSVLGFTLGPFCIGLLSDLLTPRLGIEALRYALLVPVCLIPVIVLTLYAAAKALPADLPAAPAAVTAPAAVRRR